MEFIDKEAVKAAAKPEDVAEALGIKAHRRGKSLQILCPGHFKRTGKRDHHLGNAYLTSHGYYCCSCGNSFDVFQMVQDVYEDYSFTDAVKFVGSLYGIRPENADSNQYSKERRLILPPDRNFLKEIGLCPKKHGDSYAIIGCYDEWNFFMNKDRPVPYKRLRSRDGEDEFIVKIEEVHSSVGILMREDPDAYKFLIQSKTEERIKELQKIKLDHLDDIEGAKEIDKSICNLRSDMRKYLTPQGIPSFRRKIRVTA